MLRRTTDKGQKENQSTLTRNPKVPTPAAIRTVRNDIATKGPVKADKATPTKRNVLVNQTTYVKKDALKPDKTETGELIEMYTFCESMPPLQTLTTIPDLIQLSHHHFQ